MIGTTLQTSGMFSESLGVGESPESEDDTAPYKGLHVEVRFGVDPPSKGAVNTAIGLGAPVEVIRGIWPIVVFMGSPIPYYSGEGGLRVEYALYRKGTRQAAYQYTIKKKGWGGILLLPLTWLNFFTDDLKDGLRATTVQFLIDAHRDGNL